MSDTIHQLRIALDQRRPVVYCRLVETRGSTPQKAGATMLVFENGDQAGTLGGGCVEAEVKRQALRVLKSGVAEVATFQLNHDYGWDDGLICGGRMSVLIQNVSDDLHYRYFDSLVQTAAAGMGFTEAIVVDGAKQGIATPACVLLDADGGVTAALHVSDSDSQHLQNELSANVQTLNERPGPYAANGIAFLPSLPRCRLLIVGGGHVGQAVAELAANLDFDVWVTDDRDSVVSAERFPTATRRIAGPCRSVLPDLEIDSDTYCLIVTRGHNHDQEALFHLANRGARYVGMIGSRRKIRLIFDDLQDTGISSEVLDQVHAPVGIDIGSQTVPEIAVSIAAELVAHRNRSGQVPGRPQPVRAAADPMP